MSGKLTLSGPGVFLELNAPYYPYQVRWRAGAYIKRNAAGNVTAFDPGASFDTWSFEGNFRCTPAQAKDLSTLFECAENISAFPEGFSLFGPTHFYAAHVVRIMELEHGQIQDNPFRMYSVRVVMELVSNLQTEAPGGAKVEGEMDIGTATALQMPTTSQEEYRGVRVMSRHGGNPSTLAHGTKYTDSLLMVDAREGNMGRLLAYLEAERFGELQVVSADRYFLFGADKGNGTFVCNRATKELVLSMIEHDHWRLDLPVNYVSGP